MNLVEQTAMNSTTDGKELPVEQLADGEGTVIAGTPNPHLSLTKALGCVVARIYLFKAFEALSIEDRKAYIDAQNIEHLMRVGSYATEDMEEKLSFLAYTILDAGTGYDLFIDAVDARLDAMGYITDESKVAFAVGFFTDEERVLAQAMGII